MVVLLLHAVLLEALSGHRRPAAASRGREGDARRLVLIDPAKAAAPMIAPAVSKTGRASPDGRGVSDSAAAERAADRRPSAYGVEAVADRAIPIVNYRASTVLDEPVRTRSAPDIAALEGLPWSGFPIHLRLFIDVQGTVVDAQVIESSETADVLERVRQMFLATAFTVGTENGKPVPCYKDIELTVGAQS